MKNKNKNTTLSEQLQNPIQISFKQPKSKPVTHKNMTIHFPDLVQALQSKVAGLI